MEQNFKITSQCKNTKWKQKINSIACVGGQLKLKQNTYKNQQQ